MAFVMDFQAQEISCCGCSQGRQDPSSRWSWNTPSQFWKSRFVAKNSMLDLAERHLCNFIDPLPTLDWSVPLERFSEHLDSLGSASPGPDGIRGGFYHALPPRLVSALYSDFCISLAQGEVHPELPASFTHLPPKGESALDNASTVYRHPSETRPITCSNEFCKAFEK